MTAGQAMAEPPPRHVDHLITRWDDGPVAEPVAQPGGRGFFVVRVAAIARVVAPLVWESVADTDAASHVSPRQVFRPDVAVASGADPGAGSI